MSNWNHFNRKFLRRSIFSKSKLPIPKLSFLLLGIGIYSFKISILVATLCSLHFIYNFKFKNLKLITLIFALLWLSFLILYFLHFRLPIFPKDFNGDISFEVYAVRSIPILLFVLVSLQIRSKSIFLNLIFLFSLGMLTHAILNTVATLLYVEPPYYGKAREFFTGSTVNSPGTTLLASFSSLLLIGFVGDQQVKNPSSILFLLIATGVISFFVSIVFVARTYFFIIILGIAFVSIRIIFRTKGSPLLLFLFSFSMLLLIFIYNSLIPESITERILNGVYSIKIQHTIDYFGQVSKNFFIYPKSNLVYEEYWFHNFFYDVHRSSGPYTAIVAYGIFGVTILNLLMNIERKYSKSLFIVFLLFIPYLLTTIPWESSEYQILGLYAGVTLASGK